MGVDPIYLPYEFLAPRPEPGTTLLYCDLCSANETYNIVNGPDGDPESYKLMAMYTDLRDGIIVCERCAKSGGYLDLDVDLNPIKSTVSEDTTHASGL